MGPWAREAVGTNSLAGSLVLAGVLELEKLLESVLFNGCVELLGSGSVLRRVQIQKILPELLGHVFHLLAGPIAVRESAGGLLSLKNVPYPDKNSRIEPPGLSCRCAILPLAELIKQGGHPSPRVPKRQSAMIRYCPVAFTYGRGRP